MIEVREVLLNIGYSNLKDFGSWFRTKPLYRSSDNETVLAINKNTGYWYDYKLCRGGSLSELIKISLNLTDLKEADALLKDKFQITKTSTKVEKTEVNQIKTYDESLLNGLIKDHSYWIKRGVREDVISEFNGGVALKGIMINRYVFPIYSTDNKIIGFTGRTLQKLDNKFSVKWKHLGSKKEWIFPCHLNSGIFKTQKSIFLVESIGDLLSLWQCGYKNVLVTFGLNISPRIVKFMIENQVEKVVIAFNNDSNKNSAGNEAAKEAKEKLLTFFDEQQIQIKLPNKKDFGEMSQNEIDLYMKELNG